MIEMFLSQQSVLHCIYIPLKTIVTVPKTVNIFLIAWDEHKSVGRLATKSTLGFVFSRGPRKKFRDVSLRKSNQYGDKSGYIPRELN